MTFHDSTGGRSPSTPEMAAKYSSMPLRSEARAHTAISVLYVRTLTGTCSARMRGSTASASETRPSAACTLMSVVYTLVSAWPPSASSCSKKAIASCGSRTRSAALMPAVATRASSGTGTERNRRRMPASVRA